jgi:tetratricopeptide (TPR) repeat protein
MTESRNPPSGCGMLGIYSNMFRRRRSASMSSFSRDQPAASESDAGSEAAQSPTAPKAPHRKAAVHQDASSLVRRPNGSSPLSLQNGFVARTALSASDRTSRSANGVYAGAKPAAAEYTGMVAELDRMILDHQKVKGTTQFVRATSGNMMLHRNLGNLNAGAGGASARSSVERNNANKAAANERKAPANGYAFSGMGNIVKQAARPPAGELCRALSHRTDPEKLKELGNVEYRQGHYAEAVALYDQAIIMDARRPAYWSNKAAALTALGRLIEAVGDCREAVRIDPSYDRAHNRLGGLYLRCVEHISSSFFSSSLDGNALEICHPYLFIFDQGMSLESDFLVLITYTYDLALVYRCLVFFLIFFFARQLVVELLFARSIQGH